MTITIFQDGLAGKNMASKMKKDKILDEVKKEQIGRIIRDKNFTLMRFKRLRDDHIEEIKNNLFIRKSWTLIDRIVAKLANYDLSETPSERLIRQEKEWLGKNKKRIEKETKSYIEQILNFKLK